MGQRGGGGSNPLPPLIGSVLTNEVNNHARVWAAMRSMVWQTKLPVRSQEMKVRTKKLSTFHIPDNVRTVEVNELADIVAR